MLKGLANKQTAEPKIEFDMPENWPRNGSEDQIKQILNIQSSLLGIEAILQGRRVIYSGHDAAIAKDIIQRLEEKIVSEVPVTAQDIMAMMSNYKPAPTQVKFANSVLDAADILTTKKKTATASSLGQRDYIRNLLSHDMNFGTGPAGSGKTYLAVAAGVHFLESGAVSRIILTRPAVEAGEKLGFLPGDMKEKVDPYMQPLYDALNEFLPVKQFQKMIEDRVIEISPLAYMRGRTLSNAFIILDEAQNATTMQMKMFLTRIGEHSRMAIVGDMSQNDLPKGVSSGLNEALRILDGTPGIGFTALTGLDIVRHPLVAKIVAAYESNQDG